MFGKTGFVRRVNAGVDAVLQPGEVRLAAAYLQGQRGPLLAQIFGTAIAHPFIVAVTDRRFLLLAMGYINAARSSLIADYPAGQVRVEVPERGAKGKLRLALPGGETAELNVMPAWRRETAAVADALTAQAS